MKQQHLFFLLSSGLSGFVIWLYVLTQIPTDGKNLPVIGLFFVSLAVWMSVLLGSLLYAWRLRASNREIVYAYLKPSIRQGCIVGTTASLVLVLKAFDVIGAWEIILVVLGASLFEIALSSKIKHGHTL